MTGQLREVDEVLASGVLLVASAIILLLAKEKFDRRGLISDLARLAADLQIMTEGDEKDPNSGT